MLYILKAQIVCHASVVKRKFSHSVGILGSIFQTTLFTNEVLEHGLF